ncbi:cholinephosphate cytidylyltransferase [Mycena floridula]|nr:cholinephosphate cytidylyltransferase [Mycena floridula]
MDSTSTDNTGITAPHKRTLHSRNVVKHTKAFDSPAYDASEEDNDPLTDDGGSTMSLPTRYANATRTPYTKPMRAKHHLASSVLSDSDGIDSPTYDGDIESSTTAGFDLPAQRTHHHHASSVSTLNTPTASAKSEHPVFLTQPLLVPEEPAVSAKSEEAFDPAALTPDDIQAFVQKAVDGESWRTYKINPPATDRPVRIYADGVYDLFHFGHALQLRQAKLSFPSVYLLVGVCSDELVREHKSRSIMNHAERLEAARHCRWVDEVVAEAPWIIDQHFVDKYQIDYVAHDEDPYVAEGHDDVYGFVKSQGKFIPTRRTPGVSTSELLERIVSGYRKRDFDEKLVKMGHAELRAEGSDFDDSRPVSRNISPTPHDM